MKQTIKGYKLPWLKHDLLAGLSVFFVALPLCLGIALASGAPIYSGILSGIIGGVLVSLISGSQLGVSGPAAGLTTVVSASIISNGDYRVFLLAVIIAGVFQVILGILKLGSLANYFPSSVIKGMMAAIGIILISKQIPVAIGYNQPDFWSVRFLQLFSAKAGENLKSLNQQISEGTIIITLISLGVLILFQLSFTKRFKLIPASLIVVITGVLLNHLFSGTKFHLEKEQLVNIPDSVFGNISLPDLTKLWHSGAIWKDGLMIGLLATLETLLCVEAVDKLDPRNRITPVNRELIAQGAGNIVCGLLGAIPITAVVVRGAANAEAGAKTKLSAFFHGIFLFLSVLLIPIVLNLIPYASLAAILLVTGYNLAKPSLFKNVFALGPKQFLPFMITILVILSTDLLIGVSIGLLISAYFIIQNNFKAEYKITTARQHETENFLIKLNTNVTFLNKVQLRKSLDQIPPYSILTIDGSECNFIDHDILEIISAFENKAHDRHIEVHLKGIEKVKVNSLH
jgi:MFS superfamily sulfate permease-like transporter